MSEEVFEIDGTHQFIKGSKKEVVADNTFYSHERSLRVIHYFKNNLKNNLKFNTIHLMREWLASEAYKLQMNNKLIPNHNLNINTVLVVHSDLKSPSDNKVSFYEVIALVDVCTVRLRKLKSEVFEHGNFYSTIPSVGVYEDNEEIERKVISNSVKINEGALALRLPFDLLMVAEIIPIKVYRPTVFGLKA